DRLAATPLGGVRRLRSNARHERMWTPPWPPRRRRHGTDSGSQRRPGRPVAFPVAAEPVLWAAAGGAAGAAPGAPPACGLNERKNPTRNGFASTPLTVLRS